MAIRIELRTAECPICGQRMDGTVKLQGTPGQPGYRTAPQDVHCHSSCERLSDDNRTRMLAVFEED
jgi:C4-type Zn-finger protein